MPRRTFLPPDRTRTPCWRADHCLASQMPTEWKKAREKKETERTTELAHVSGVGARGEKESRNRCGRPLFMFKTLYTGLGRLLAAATKKLSGAGQSWNLQTPKRETYRKEGS